MKCHICKEEFEKDDFEDNICNNCMSSIISSEFFFPDGY
jgi:hypothetical protein